MSHFYRQLEDRWSRFLVPDEGYEKVSLINHPAAPVLLSISLFSYFLPSSTPREVRDPSISLIAPATSPSICRQISIPSHHFWHLFVTSSLDTLPFIFDTFQFGAHFCSSVTEKVLKRCQVDDQESRSLVFAEIRRLPEAALDIPAVIRNFFLFIDDSMRRSTTAHLMKWKHVNLTSM